MVVQQDTTANYVTGLLNDGHGREYIENLLLEKGLDVKFVKELVAESIKLRNTRRRAQGLVLILAGAVICFLSFLMTITSAFSSNSFPYILYGITSLGVIVVFFGLMRVF